MPNNEGPTALWLCLERIIPARRDRPVRFELPQIKSIADAVAASAALLTEVAAGDLTPSEAVEIGKLVDSDLRSIEATEFEKRLARLEKGTTMKRSLRNKLETVERHKRTAAKARPWITEGSSEEEEGEWRGNYFVRRTPMTMEEWIAKFVTSE